MKALLATYLRELKGFFYSPLGWVVAAMVLLVNGFVFWLLLAFLNDPRSSGSLAPLQLFFGGTFLFWLVLLFVAPVLTMKLIAEERRQGTIEMLMTAPVTEGQVVLGKYFAALTFYCFIWAPTIVYPLILERYSEVDWGPVASGYLGVFLIGALFLAVGTFASAWARSQIVAAVIAFALLAGLFALALVESLVQPGSWAAEVLGYGNLWQHMDEFSRGIIDSRRIVFLLTTSGLFVFLAARVLESKKWT